LPIALEHDDIQQLDDIIKRGRPLQQSNHVYREAESFHSVYAVRSGSVKAYRAMGDGREQVIGFYFPGEIIGLDGISSNTHNASAKTLETAVVCEIPFSSLKGLSSIVPPLQRHLFRLMSRGIIEDQQRITLLSRNSAAERIAFLLLSISARNISRKLSGTRFRLSMSRLDIGNYLGLTVETISRVFSQLQKMAVLEVDNREIAIVDMLGLRKLSNLVD
tara:strand:+ start:57 stop:713 length:657 start_codon:yes stop_codon:yes gene_type:complete